MRKLTEKKKYHENGALKEKKKEWVCQCDRCFSPNIYFRKDKTYFCRACGYDSGVIVQDEESVLDG